MSQITVAANNRSIKNIKDGRWSLKKWLLRLE